MAGLASSLPDRESSLMQIDFLDHPSTEEAYMMELDQADLVMVVDRVDLSLWYPNIRNYRDWGVP